jgi:hypothetical protein
MRNVAVSILAAALLVLASPARAVCPATNTYPFEANCPLPAAELNKALGGSGNIVAPVDYDALCGGQTTEAEIALTPPIAHDCTTAINLAAAVIVNGAAPEVRLQAGLYYVTNETLLDRSQVFAGDGRGLTGIRVRDTFSPTARGVFVLGTTAMHYGVGETIRDLYITFDQPPTPSGGRAGFVNVTTGCSITGGPGCKYPPAILMLGTAAGSGGRNTFNDLRIERAWDGIAGDAVGTVNSPNGFGNQIYQIYNLEISALNKGLWIDGVADQSMISGFHFWTFGMNGTHLGLMTIMADGDTDCINIGRQDGSLFTNIFCHDTAIRTVSSQFLNEALAPFALVGEWSNVSLDHGSLIIEDTDHLEISNFSGSAGPTPAYPHLIDVQGGLLNLSNVGPNHITAVPAIGVSGGVLNLQGGSISSPGVDVASVLVTSGTARIRNVNFATGGTNRTIAVVKQTGGNLVFQNNSVTTNAGQTGVVLETTLDSAGNWITGNKFGGWPVSLGCGATTGGWCYTTTDGFYDLPDVPFTMGTITPSFGTLGDFVPANIVSAGRWWLRGDHAEYKLSYEFDTNAYTTAAGTFTLSTALPSPSNPATMHSGCTPSLFSKVSLAGAVQAMCHIAGTAGTVDWTFPTFVSGAASGLMGVASFPASTTDMRVDLFGRYQIR